MPDTDPNFKLGLALLWVSVYKGYALFSYLFFRNKNGSIISIDTSNWIDKEKFLLSKSVNYLVDIHVPECIAYTHGLLTQHCTFICTKNLRSLSIFIDNACELQWMKTTALQCRRI